MARGHVTIDGKPYLLQDESYSSKPVPMFRPQLQVEGISHEALDQYLYMVQGTWDKGTNERQERDGWSGGTWRTMAGLDSSEAGKLRLQRATEVALAAVAPPEPLIRAAANGSATGQWERSLDGVTFSTQTLAGVSAIWLNERNGANMLALTGPTEIQRSTDGGDTWSVLTALPIAGHHNSCFEHSLGAILVGQPANGDGDIRVFRSVDGGVSWTDILVATRIPTSSRVYPGTFVECDDGSILMHDDPNAAGSDHTRIYRSTDQGASWTSVFVGAAVVPTATLGNMSYLYGLGIAYFLVDDGVASLQLLRSTDHGVTWANVAPAGMAAQNLLGVSSKTRNAVARLANGDHAVTTGSSFWRSTNAGLTWTEDAPSSPGASTRSGLAVTIEGTILCVRDITGMTVRKSVDNAASWTTEWGITGGATLAASFFTTVLLPAIAATGKAILISAGGFLYAFMESGDVFRTEDGTTWSTVTYDDLTYGVVTAVDLHVVTGKAQQGAGTLPAPGGTLQLAEGSLKFVAGTSTGRLWHSPVGATLTPTVVSTKTVEITLVKSYRGHVGVGYANTFEMWPYAAGAAGTFAAGPKYTASVPGVPVAAAVWNSVLMVLIQVNQQGSLLAVADLTQISDAYEVHGEFLGQSMTTWGSELVYAGSRLNTQGEVYTFQENLSDLLPVTTDVPAGIRALAPSAHYVLAAHNGEAGLWWIDKEGGGPLCGANAPGAAATRVIDSIAYFLGRPYFNLRNTGIMRMSTTTYRTSGTMDTGWFTGGFPELTKEWAEVVVRLEAALAADQTVTLSGRIDADTAFTSIGSLTTGDTSRVLTIPAALRRSKRFEIRCAMTGPGTSTPTVTAIIARYLPRPVPMRVWGFTVKAFKGMELLDGSKEHRTPEQIIDDLYGLMLTGQVSFSSVIEPTATTVYAINIQIQAQLLGKTQTDGVRAQEEAHIAVELLEALTSDFGTA